MRFLRAALPVLLFFVLTHSSSPIKAQGQAAPASPEFRRTLGLGITYAGGQLRYGFKKAWAAEFRFLTDKSSSDQGDVSGNVVGLRGYRQFRTEKRMQWYAGIEAAYINAKLKDAGALSAASSYSSNGYALGGFAGIEYYIVRRLSIALDMGPYLIQLKDASYNASETGVDFILTSLLNFYIF